MTDASLINRLFDVIEDDIVPMTERGVADGNKLFGAAILRKSDLSVVVAETNNETDNPLWHGEVHALKRFYELPRPTGWTRRIACSSPPTSRAALPVGHLTGFDNLLPVQPRGSARQLRYPARIEDPQGGLHARSAANAETPTGSPSPCESSCAISRKKTAALEARANHSDAMTTFRVLSGRQAGQRHSGSTEPSAGGGTARSVACSAPASWTS